MTARRSLRSFRATLALSTAPAGLLALPAAVLLVLPCAASGQVTPVGTVLATQNSSEAGAAAPGVAFATAAVGPPTVTTTTVTLNAKNTVVDWASLNVLNNATVSQTLNFTNATSSAAGTNVAVLNRVAPVALNTTTISGTISQTANANGSGVEVWISNPNGLLIGGGANINTNGLVLTTLPIGTFGDAGTAFTNGGAIALGGPASSGSLTTITSSGAFTITTHNGGLAVIAPAVQLDGTGTYTAGTGDVAFVAATDVTLQSLGSPLSLTINQGTRFDKGMGRALSVAGTVTANRALLVLSAQQFIDTLLNVDASVTTAATTANGVVILAGDNGSNADAGLATGTGDTSGGGSVTIGGAVNTGAARLVLGARITPPDPLVTGATAGPGTIAATGTLTAANLSARAGGSVALNAANLIGTVDALVSTADTASLTNAQALTIGGSGVSAVGNATLATTAGALTIAAPVVSTGGAASLTGAGGIGLGAAVTGLGNVSLNSAVMLTAPTEVKATGTVAANGAAGSVSFGSTVDGAYGLTVTAEGTKSFAGSIGAASAANRLASLTTNGTGAASFGAGATAVTTTGDQTYNTPVAIGADTVFTGANGQFGSITGNNHALTLSFSGGTGLSGITGVTTLVNDNGGTTTLNGDVATTGSQTWSDAVVLGTSVVTVSSGGTAASGGTIAFNGTVAASTAGGQSLIVSTPGAVTFAGVVGGTPLASLDTSGAGTTILNVTPPSTGSSVATTGAQQYGALVLQKNTTIDAGAGAVTFAGSLNGTAGTETLGVTAATATFGGVVGATRLGALDTSGVRTTFLNIIPPSTGSSVMTSGAQRYGALVLQKNTTLDAGTGAVTFAGTLDGTAGTETLSVTAATTTFGGVVGATHTLGSLTAGTTRFDIAPPSTGASVTTTGAQRYGATTLVQDASLASGSAAVTFTGTIDSATTARALAVTTTGLVSIAGAVGTTPLASLTTDGVGGSTSLGGNVTTTGAQTYNNLTVAGPHAGQTLASTGGGAITFNGTLDADSFAAGTGARLAVNTAGVTAFNGAVGGTNQFTSLFTDAPGSSTIAANVTGETIRFNDPVTVTGTRTITGGITFASTVAGPGGLVLTGSTTKTATLGLGTAATPLAALVVNGPGALYSTGDIVTSGDQTYNTALYLGVQTPHPAHTTTLSGASLIFGGTPSVTGVAAESLLLDFAGVTTLNTAIFQGFTGLTVGPAGGRAGARTDLGGSLSFSGDLTFNNAVRLIANAAVTSTSGAVTFGNTVDGSGAGGQNLTIDAAGAATLNGAVGSTLPLGMLAIVNRNATTFIGSDVTAATQSYGEAVVLTGAAATTQTLTASSGLTFAGTLGSTNPASGSDLVLTGAGARSFAGAVTLGGALTSATGGALAINGGSVTTAGGQTYNDAVALGAATTTLTGTTGAINGLLTAGGRDLTLNFSGDSNLNGALVTGVRTLDVGNGGTTTLFNTVSTTGTQRYRDAIVLGNDVAATSTGNAAISFDGVVVAAAAGVQRLTVTTGGTTTFGGAVGSGGAAGTGALASLTTSSGPVAINGGSVITTVSQSYGGAVTLGADTVLTSGTFTFAAGLNGNPGTGDHSLTLTASGAKTIANFTGLADLLVNGGGTITLANITTSGTQTYQDPTILSGTPTTLYSTGTKPGTTGNITFGSTVDGGSLLVRTGGQTAFNGTVGGATPLIALVTDAGGTTRIAADVTAATQMYNDAVVASGTRTLTAATAMSFLAGLSGASDLTLRGAGTRTFGAGGGFVSLASLVSDTGGALAINGGGVTTSGLQTYNDAVTLGANTVLASTGGGAITLAGTVNAASAGVQALTIDTTGTTTINGVIGGLARLASLTTLAGGTTRIAADVTADTQTYNDALVASGTRTLTAGTSMAFLAGLSGASDLTLRGAGARTFGANGGIVSLTSLVSDIGGALAINGGGVTTTGLQTYNDAVTLGADAVLTSTGAGAITFGNALDGGGGLTVNTAGVTAFNGVVGGGTPLASITTDAGGTTRIAADVTAVAQTYNDAVVATGTRTLTASGSMAFLAGLSGASDLTLKGAGARTFGANGGIVSLTSLVSDTGGALAINGGGVTTTGLQTYNDAVTLGADTRLVSTGAGALTLAGTTDGAYVLSLSTGGAARLGGVAGGSIALRGLAINAASFSAVAGNRVGTLAARVAGGLVYDDAAALTIGTVDGLSGIDTGASPTTVSAGGTLTLASNVAAGNTSLAGVGVTQAAGTSVNAGAGTIAIDGRQGAVALAGSLATTNATAAAVRVVNTADAAIGTITTGAAGTVTLGTAGGGAIGGALAQTAGATITTGTLVGTVTGRATLANAGNSIATLGAFTANGFALRDSRAGLTVTGPVNAGTGDLSLTLDSGTLTLQGDLVAATGTVSLVSGGPIVQTGGGIIAAVLTGSSVGGASLTSATNAVGRLGGFTNTGGGGFAFTNGLPLVVTGDISTTGDLTLTANGIDFTGRTIAAGGALTLAGGSGDVTGATATAGTNLTVSGAAIAIDTAKATAGNLSLTASGANRALTLGTGNAGGAATLSSQGTIGVTGSLTAGGAATLTAVGAATLAQIGAGAALTVTGNGITAGTSTAGTTLTFTSSGDITATTATAGTDLTARGVTVAIGTAKATNGALALTATGSGGALTLGTGTAGGAATLSSQGTIGVTGSLMAGGAATLTAVGAATLAQSSAGSALAVTANGITAGTSTAGTTLTFTSSGDLAATTATAGTDLTATGTGIAIDNAKATTGALALTATGNGRALTLGTGTAGGAATLSSQGTIATTGQLVTGGAATLTAVGSATLAQTSAGSSLAVTANGIAATTSTAGTTLTFTSGGDVTATTATAGTNLTATGAGIAIDTAKATAGALSLTASGAGRALTLGTGTAGGAATLASQGTIALTTSLTTGTTAMLTATGAATLGQTNAGTALSVSANGITAGATRAGTTLTLTSGGNVALASGQAGGDVLIDANGTASLGTVTAGTASGITIRALDAAVTGAQTAARVAFVNRSPSSIALKLGNGTSSGGFQLSQDEVNLVNAGALTVDGGPGNIELGALAFNSAAGSSSVTMLSTGRIDVLGAVSGGGGGRTFRLGGTATSADDKANVIQVVATTTGGGRLLFDTADLDLRGGRIGVGQAAGFLTPIGFGSSTGLPASTIAAAYVANATSALYNATYGGAAYAVPAPTLVSARSMTVRYTDYALFQNTGAPGINAGVVLGGTTSAPVSNALVLQGSGSGSGNAFGLFGTINGVSGTATALLGPVVIGTNNVNLVNTRINGCVVGSGAGCLTSVVSQPTLNVFDASQLNVFRSADDLVLPFDPVVGGNNEALFSGVDPLDVSQEAIDCAAHPDQACRPAEQKGTAQPKPPQPNAPTQKGAN